MGFYLTDSCAAEPSSAIPLYPQKRLPAATDATVGRRFYSPSQSRWLSRDPLGEWGSDNTYSFCLNNALLWIDATGLEPSDGGVTTAKPPPACATCPRGGPPYQPDIWNRPGIQENNNCYSYACDRMHGPIPFRYPPVSSPVRGKPQPGQYSGEPISGPPYNCADVIKKAKADGMEELDEHGCCRQGWHRVKAYVGDRIRVQRRRTPQGTTVSASRDAGADYHWYRQDAGGTWSHKPGGGEVSYLDASGQEISDPASANRDYTAGGMRPGFNYYQECGELCASTDMSPSGTPPTSTE